MAMATGRFDDRLFPAQHRRQAEFAAGAQHHFDMAGRDGYVYVMPADKFHDD